MLLVQSPTLPGLPARQGWFFPWHYLASLAHLGLLDMYLGLPKELILLSWPDLGVAIFLLSLCTVWATDPGFVAPTMMEIVYPYVIARGSPWYWGYEYG